MDPLLYGSNTEENIVAVHLVSDHLMRIYYKNYGKITTKDVDFYPFFYLSNHKFIEDFPKKYWIKELNGDNYFRYLCAFTSWFDMWDAIRFILNRYNENAPAKVSSYLDLPILHLRPDPISQYLKQSGKTLFKGISFKDLYRIQIQIEAICTPGFKTRNPNRIGDKIVVIAVTDNRGEEHVFHTKRKSEKYILNEFIELIKKKDPDVIEGHNILRFDLPYILSRCNMLSVEPSIGRDGSVPKTVDMKHLFPERTFGYPLFEIAGRHVIDTQLLFRSFDSANRFHDEHSLMAAEKHFNIKRDERTYIQSDKITWYWENEPEKVIQFCSDNVRSVKKISDILTPSIFNLTQMLPFNFGSVIRLGTLAKIESLLLREYINQKYSIPKSSIGTQSYIEYSKIFQTGIFESVLHLEAECLYASIIQNYNIKPKTDTLGIFLILLEKLKKIYSGIHNEVSLSNKEDERQILQLYLQTIKSIIDSFYDYLGSNKTIFNDYKAADSVAQRGYNIIHKIISQIHKSGGKVIQVDGNDIFFVPPQYVIEQKVVEQFINEITKRFEFKIELNIKKRFKRMLSFKKKNYALIDYDGNIEIIGPYLLSRTIEKFGRDYIRESIEALLNNEINNMHKIYIKYHQMISRHQLNIRDFVRSEILRENYESYMKEIEEGKKNRSGTYELAIQSGLNWKPGDRIYYYISNINNGPKGFENFRHADEWDPNFPDESIQYYTKRLDDFAKKFEDFFSEGDFHIIFSKDDQLGFSYNSIKILNKFVESEKQEITKEGPENFHIEPKIWLDDEFSE